MDLFSKQEGYEIKLSLVVTGAKTASTLFAHAYDPEYPEEGLNLSLLGKEELLPRTGWESVTEWGLNQEEIEIEVIMERTPTEWLDDFTKRCPEGFDIAYQWRELPNGQTGGWRRVNGEFLPLAQ